MTCRSILSQPPVVLNKSDSVADAVAALISHKFPTLPVVDARGRYAGVFGAKHLIALMLPPAAAKLADEMGDLGFLTDSAAQLRARLEAMSGDSVGQHMGAHRTVSPETPLAEAVLLLYRGDAFLPVVDSGGILVGIVTPSEVLNSLA